MLCCTMLASLCAASAEKSELGSQFSSAAGHGALWPVAVLLVSLDPRLILLSVLMMP